MWSVRPPTSNVPTIAVSQGDGAVTMTMIVVTRVMRLTVQPEFVQRVSSAVTTRGQCRLCSYTLDGSAVVMMKMMMMMMTIFQVYPKDAAL